jgi:predicted molibdopterin-dependent oxidoreductase YjgC
MFETISLRVDGRTVQVPAGTTVAVAVMIAGTTTFRRSVSGQPRGPLCGMGICFECRLTIDGRTHCRSCQVESRDGMEVTTI